MTAMPLWARQPHEHTHLPWVDGMLGYYLFPRDTLCGLKRDHFDEDEDYTVTVLGEVTCPECQEMARRFPQLFNQLRAKATEGAE